MNKLLKWIVVLSFLCVLSGLLLPGKNDSTKAPISGTKTLSDGTVIPKEAKTPGETQATKVKAIGLTMLDKPIADLLTATESIVIKDQEEAKTTTGKIKITYKYQDNSELTVICNTSSTGLIIYSIIE